MKRICSIETGEDYQLSIEEQTANAKLIASAPDVLDCCIDILRILELKPNYVNLYQRNKLKRAIKKATE